MKRLAIGALAVFTLAAFAGTADAQLGSQFGELYFSTTQDGTGANFNENLAAFAQFDIFVIADIDFADDNRGGQNLTNGLTGWEAEFNVPAAITVLGRELNPPSAVNVGSGDNFIVGTGTLFTADSTPVFLVKYQGGLFVQEPPVDLVITVGPATPNSENTGGPNWLESATAGTGEIHEFADTWMDARFVVNCSEDIACNEVATRDESFGSVKARF